jgi:hypothetical protein
MLNHKVMPHVPKWYRTQVRQSIGPKSYGVTDVSEFSTHIFEVSSEERGLEKRSHGTHLG